MDKKIVLTIAGSDPSGHAGSQADLKTLSECGAKGVSAVTAITGHDQTAGLAIHPTAADVLTQQLAAACREQTPAAIKIGMVATQANIRVLTWFLRHTPAPHVVIDPILHSSSGIPLLENKAFSFYRQQLLPMASLITPNLREASALAGQQVAGEETMRVAAEAIYNEINHYRMDQTKPLAILIKGGHLIGDPIDMLYDGKEFSLFSAKRINDGNVSGTGCRFSSALAAYLAQGEDLRSAIEKAQAYLLEWIKQVTA